MLLDIWTDIMRNCLTLRYKPYSCPCLTRFGIKTLFDNDLLKIRSDGIVLSNFMAVMYRYIITL